MSSSTVTPAPPLSFAALHQYSVFPYVLRVLYTADMMIGAALWNARQTGLDKLQAVREKLADPVSYREDINGHVVAAIAEAQKSPAGLLMPHQSLLMPDACMPAQTCRR